MNELRWILIGFGIALLAVIYLWGRRSAGASGLRDTRHGPEPRLDTAAPHPGEPFLAAGEPDRRGSYDLEYESRHEPAIETPTGEGLHEPLAELREGHGGRRGRLEPTFTDTLPTEALPLAPDSGAYSSGARASLDRAARDPSIYDRAARGSASDLGVSAVSATGAAAFAGTGNASSSLEGGSASKERLETEPRLAGAAPSSATPGSEPSPGQVRGAAAGTAASATSASAATQSRRIERRKILSLRLSAVPHRLDGAKLLEALQAESLEHGKYSVFHRLHTDGSQLFSVASMVEPGTFDLDLMSQTQYPGVTLFAQLPGPVPGMHALNELVACARRLQQSLGGTLQDERGVPLTVHRIERMRQEVREFERPAGAGRPGADQHSPAT